MNGQEATGVLREVQNEFSDYLNINFVSLTDSAFQTRVKSTGYKIYVKCDVCGGLMDCLSLLNQFYGFLSR